EAVAPAVLNFAQDREIPALVCTELEVVDELALVVGIGWPAETQRSPAGAAIGAVVAEDESRAFPAGLMEHPSTSGMHTPHHEHVGEVRRVLEPQRDFRWAPRVVLNSDLLREVVVQRTVASNSKHLLG